MDGTHSRRAFQNEAPNEVVCPIFWANYCIYAWTNYSVQCNADVKNKFNKECHDVLTKPQNGE